MVTTQKKTKRAATHWERKLTLQKWLRVVKVDRDVFPFFFCVLCETWAQTRFGAMANVQNIKTDQIRLQIDERNKIIIICFGFVKVAVTVTSSLAGPKTGRSYWLCWCIRHAYALAVRATWIDNEILDTFGSLRKRESLRLLLNRVLLRREWHRH